MQSLARRLIAAERRASDSGDTDGLAAFRVCNRLRESLSPLTGKRGFRALLARALALAAVDAPWLRKVELEESGSTHFPVLAENELHPGEAARGGVALVTHLLELLSTFIGEALTLRFVQQVWPEAALSDPKSKEKT
jgi:hypothetical protein